MTQFSNFPTCHSHPQSLDSGSTPEAFAKREVELGTGVLTATDHGSLAACRQIYDLAKKNKLIPVLGMEGYLRDDDCPILAKNGYRKNATGAFIGAPKYMHFCVHFQDQKAYECAIRLLSAADANLEERLAKMEPDDRRHGKERKPLFTWRDMEELGAQNVTMTTGCMIGVVQRHLKDNDDMATATAYFEKMKSLVKPGNLYVELNPHDTSMNWVQGIFLTMKDGTKLRWYDGKTLRTDAGEIKAGELAKLWKSGGHKVLLAVKNNRTWEELVPTEIERCEEIRDYLPNECRPWATDGDIQAGLNRAMRILAQRYNVPIMVGDDSHYATPDEKVVQDVRLAQSGPWRFYGSYHRMSSEEAFTVLSRKLDIKPAEFGGWVENAHGWASKFKDFKFDTPPSLPTKFYEEKYALQPWYRGDRHDSFRYTMDLIKKHGRMNWQDQTMRDRLKTEIDLLHNNGTIDLLPYFMVDEEVCSFFEERKLLTGPGRGSAAGLLLTYLLGITHVDPIKYNLSVERFITLDRISSGGLPDIDQDLPKIRRGLLIDDQTGWLKQRFGDHYAQISVDSTLRVRQAIQDVSREQRGHVPGEIYKLTGRMRMPPMGVTDHDFVLGNDKEGEEHIQGSCETDPALIEYIYKFPADWEIVKKCLGLPRHKGKHACAFVIANRPISEFIPMTTVADGRVTSYTAKSVEAVGGLKMDFLGLGALDDITDCIRLIQADGIDPNLGNFEDQTINGKFVPGYRIVPHWGNDGGYGDGDVQMVDIWDLPEDQRVFEDISYGRTETVFQCNTPGAQGWLKNFAHLKPDGTFAIGSIEDLSAFNALNRPGPLDMNVRKPGYTGPIERPKSELDLADWDPNKTRNMLQEFAVRARGEEQTRDILDIFNELLPATHGVMVYQEQLQFMYQRLTGCSLSDAEKFRKLVAKKDYDKVQAMEAPFIEKATAELGEKSAREVWEFFKTWAKYGFNKSHSVCYSVIGYACAYLKRHYPRQWWCAVLRNASKNEVSEKFWRHVSKFIDLPDVKFSADNYEIQGDKIRMPLSQLQGVGGAAADQLKLYAPYTDIADFCQKIALHTEKTGTWIPKVKVKKVKVLDPTTGKKVSTSVETVEKVLKRGHNALNRKVLRACILTGAMDSLFPPGLTDGEKFEAFELELAKAMGKKKAEPVDSKLWDIQPVTRYQIRKQILPVYGEDLGKLVAEQYGSNFFEFNQDSGEKYRAWTNPKTGRHMVLNVVGAGQVEQLEIQRLSDKQSVTVAACAYVESHELRNFGENKEKEMCKLQLDIDGGRYDYVAWPKSDSNQVSDIYRQNLKGAVVLVILNRYKDDKPFQLSELFVIEQPLPKGKEKEEEDEPAEPEQPAANA